MIGLTSSLYKLMDKYYKKLYFTIFTRRIKYINY